MRAERTEGVVHINARGVALNQIDASPLPSIKDELDGATPEALVAEASLAAFLRFRATFHKLGMAAELIAAGYSELVEGTYPGDALFQLEIRRGPEHVSGEGRGVGSRAPVQSGGEAAPAPASSAASRGGGCGDDGEAGTHGGLGAAGDEDGEELPMELISSAAADVMVQLGAEEEEPTEAMLINALLTYIDTSEVEDTMLDESQALHATSPLRWTTSRWLVAAHRGGGEGGSEASMSSTRAAGGRGPHCCAPSELM